ncbi:TPA: hypothetical protein ACX6Q6_003539 [Photobacterium damselae]
MHYGLQDKQQALDLATLISLHTCVNSSQHLARLLLETACAETLLGNLKDPTPNGAGTGLTQMDKGTFDWLQEKYKDRAIATKIKNELNVDIGTVKYAQLGTDPKLSLIFCRLRYLAVPAPVPSTLAERAAYWKRWYNTKYGAGTVEEYISKANQYLYS